MAIDVTRSMQALVMNDVKVPLVMSSVSVPDIQPDEVLIEVYTSSINPADWKVWQENFFNVSMPWILGCDFSGRIAKIGDKVIGWNIGDEVFGHNSLYQRGSFAEFLAVQADRIAWKPKNLSHNGAAAMPVVFLSAHEGLFYVGQLKENQTVYIPGGGGGVGHMAVQLAKAMGAKVITSASTPESLELCRQAGADFVFDYSLNEPSEQVKLATVGHGADLVFDTTYGAGFEQSALCVAEGGKFVSLGSGPSWRSNAYKALKDRKVEILECDLSHFSQSSSRSSVKEHCGDALRKLVTLYEQGKIKPCISKVVDFTGIPFELEAMKNGRHNVGKIAVQIRPEPSSTTGNITGIMKTPMSNISTPSSMPIEHFNIRHEGNIHAQTQTLLHPHCHGDK